MNPFFWFSGPPGSCLIQIWDHFWPVLENVFSNGLAPVFLYKSYWKNILPRLCFIFLNFAKCWVIFDPNLEYGLYWRVWLKEVSGFLRIQNFFILFYSNTFSFFVLLGHFLPIFLRINQISLAFSFTFRSYLIQICNWVWPVLRN